MIALPFAAQRATAGPPCEKPKRMHPDPLPIHPVLGQLLQQLSRTACPDNRTMSAISMARSSRVSHVAPTLLAADCPGRVSR